MRKFLATAAIALFSLAIRVSYVYAIYDPLLNSNNFFGIHIADINDLPEAATLVNSSGGDWGYVTFVIQNGERDSQRWKVIFEKMGQLHLIPIVRVATRPSISGWEKATGDEIDGWVSFLGSLPWPTKNRYVVIGNEPNHVGEWGGFVSPEEYSKYLETFSLKLKGTSAKFFVLPAGLDASATNPLFTMDEELFVRRMLLANPKIFDYIDGWTSHSYPNPGFSGSEYAYGRKSIRTYEWELNLLKSLGVERSLSVFITETGWINTLGEGPVGQKLKYAFGNVWTGKNIVAVTPFILNYQAAPFDVFSWRNSQSQYYDFYYQIKNLPKKKGEPRLEPTSTPLATPVPISIPVSGPKAVKSTTKSFLEMILDFFKRI